MNNKKEQERKLQKQKAIAELKAFRDKGETFNLLGVTMLVVDHTKPFHTPWGIDLDPCLVCTYVDKNGVLQQNTFLRRDLPWLRAHNGEQQPPARPKTTEYVASVDSPPYRTFIMVSGAVTGALLVLFILSRTL